MMMMMMPSITAHCQDACNVGDEGGCTLGGISTTATREWLSVILLEVWNCSSNRIDLPWFIHPIVLENMGFGKIYPEARWNPVGWTLRICTKRPRQQWGQAPSKCSEHVGTNSRKTDYVSPGLEILGLFDGLYTWYDRVLSFEQKMGGQLVGAHQPTTWDLQFQNFPVMFGYACPAYSLRCLSQPSKSIPFKPTLSHWLSG